MTKIERFLNKVSPEPMSGCWIWTGSCFRLGYGSVRFEGKTRSAHRLAWELLRGPIPEGLNVLHKCDVPSCVNPDHLFAGTHQENMQDKAAKGRCNLPNGENNPMAKLTEDNVREIREKYVWGVGVHLARKFGVHRSIITDVVKGKTWRRVI